MYVTVFESRPYFTSSDHSDMYEALPIPTFEESLFASPISLATKVLLIPTF